VPDDHPGLAAEYERAQHPSKWTGAHFDWFSDESAVLGLATSEANARAQLARWSRCMEGDLVVLTPRSHGRRRKTALDSA
jgi:hypothetical protein